MPSSPVTDYHPRGNFYNKWQRGAGQTAIVAKHHKDISVLTASYFGSPTLPANIASMFLISFFFLLSYSNSLTPFLYRWGDWPSFQYVDTSFSFSILGLRSSLPGSEVIPSLQPLSTVPGASPPHWPRCHTFPWAAKCGRVDVVSALASLGCFPP